MISVDLSLWVSGNAHCLRALRKHWDPSLDASFSFPPLLAAGLLSPAEMKPHSPQAVNLLASVLLVLLERTTALQVSEAVFLIA